MISDRKYEAVCKCLCSVGVFTLWYVPLEGQCLCFINFQRPVFGMCAMSGAIAYSDVEHEISILCTRIKFHWMAVDRKRSGDGSLTKPKLVT